MGAKKAPPFKGRAFDALAGLELLLEVGRHSTIQAHVGRDQP